MTSNQINMLRHLEDVRHNYEVENETYRSNRARETETYRSNRARESETKRANLAEEAYRNMALIETSRHNVRSEYIDIANVRELERSNKSREEETNRHNQQNEIETKRHNKREEGIKNATIDSTNRLNDARATQATLGAVGSLVGGMLGFMGAIG